MQTTTPLTRFLLSTFFLAGTAACVAQGPPGHDPYNPPPGHGGVPPGQAKKEGYDHMPPGQAKKHGYEHVPPGQAKKYRDDYHFHGEDRERFYTYYRSDTDYWRHHRRPVFVTGRAVPSGYVIRPVPQSYWVGPPPPPGYEYGYYGGYVVAYNPGTRIVADVLDLTVTATIR